MRLITDIVDNYYRLEVRSMDDFIPNKFHQISIDLINDVRAIIGSLSDDSGFAIRSYLFNKEYFNDKKIRKWIIDNEGRDIIVDNSLKFTIENDGVIQEVLVLDKQLIKEEKDADTCPK